LLLHLGQLLAGLVQVQPQHHQTHAEQGWQQPGAGRPLRPGWLQQPAAQALGRRSGGRRRVGQRRQRGRGTSTLGRLEERGDVCPFVPAPRTHLVARAFVEPAGGYVFRGVEPGAYNLHVYQGEREIAPAQAVSVGDNRELTVAPIALQR
jgi:hypothetical protein